MPANSGAITGTIDHDHSSPSAQGGFLQNNITGVNGTGNGSMLMFDGSSIAQDLPAGNLNDILTMGAAVPAWSPAGAPPSSTWRKLGSHVVSGGAVSFFDITWTLADTADFMQIWLWTNGAGVTRRYLQFYDSTGTLDTTFNYIQSTSTNMAAAGAGGANQGIGGYDNNQEMDLINVSHPDTTQDAITSNIAVNSISGIGSAPTVRMIFGKWANPSAITGIRIINLGTAGTYLDGSACVVLGTDI